MISPFRNPAAVSAATWQHRVEAGLFGRTRSRAGEYAQLDAVRRDIEDAVSYLEGRLALMRRSPGLSIVLDANVLLQSQRPDNANWVAELNRDARLMLPLRVLEEIDAEKHSPSDRLKQRARDLLPWINGLFPAGDVGLVRPRKGATIEVLMSERPRDRPTDADEEVLDVCHDVVRFAGRGKLMTGDANMRLRAMAEGLDVFFLPAGWDRDPADRPSG
jgi:hypothetical protein